MQRAKRDHDNSSSNQWYQQQQSQRPRQNLTRQAPTYSPAPKRQRMSFPGGSTLIASNRLASHLSSNTLAASPCLSDLHNAAWSQERATTLWDRSPPGYDYLNVRVLKLFNLAHPTTDFQSQELPAQLRAIKNLKALRPENSRLFRSIQLPGNEEPTMFPDILSASLKVVELHGKLNRPHPLPNLRTEKTEILYGDNERRCLATLADPDCIVVSGCSNIDQIQHRYNSEVIHYYSLGPETFAVVFADPQPPQSPLDFSLYTPAAEKSVPLIEVLNAFPMAPTGRSTIAHITGLIGKLCEEFDSGPVKSILVNNGRKVVGRPLWVTISLEDPARVHDVAEKLGTVKLQGRPLITSVGESH